MTKNSPQLVQIALPTYNGAEHIGEALTSLCRQTHAEIVVHVMDNASTDGTSDIVADMARRDQRVVHHRSAEFVPATANWLRAFEKIDRARSNYFMWASDDDLWEEAFIEKLVSDLEGDREAVLAFPQYRSIDAEGAINDLFYDIDLPATDSFRQIICLLNYGKFSAIYGVLRLRYLEWTPIFADLSFGSDRWFLINLAARGHFRLRREVLFYKRTGGISETGIDQSASWDPEKVWILDDTEREEIMNLSFQSYQAKQIYDNLRIQSKMFFPDKRFPVHIEVRAAVARLIKNKRALGLRTKMTSLLKTGGVAPSKTPRV